MADDMAEGMAEDTDVLKRLPFAVLCLWLASVSVVTPAQIQGRPIWRDNSGRLTADARDAMDILAGAGKEGLDPKAYEAGSPEQGGMFDTRLTDGMLRYLRDLHLGRVDPRSIGFVLRVLDHAHDFAALLRDAVARHELRRLVSDLTPQYSLYRDLRSALAQYRMIAASEPDVSWTAATIRPGDRYPDLAALRHRLTALGDLTVGAEAGDSYSGALVDAVRRFQARHGLEDDGIIGPRTLAALRVPLQWRVRQIELALERLRWLPDPRGDRLILVNIPTFDLWAWDQSPLEGPPSFRMGVIVGRAISTETPVLSSDLGAVIFRPSWTIPASIVTREILPAVQRHADYLAEHEMELVDGTGDQAKVLPPTSRNLQRLKRGALLLRQRPGPENPLGLVKFVFPNDADVYMHGTPEPELFSRLRRDFSHGCIRVEDPVRLATWALEGRSEWTRENVVAAMSDERTVPISVPRPIHVALFYVTAIVPPASGSVSFAEDIYGHDMKLDRALAGR